MKESNVKVHKLGLVDVDTYAYEIESKHSWINFHRIQGDNVFVIQMIGTEGEDRRRGHATALLDAFFRLVKKTNGRIEIDAYTSAGEIYIKPVIERLAKKYGVNVRMS